MARRMVDDGAGDTVRNLGTTRPVIKAAPSIVAPVVTVPTRPAPQAGAWAQVGDSGGEGARYAETWVPSNTATLPSLQWADATQVFNGRSEGDVLTVDNSAQLFQLGLGRDLGFNAPATLTQGAGDSREVVTNPAIGQWLTANNLVAGDQALANTNGQHVGQLFSASAAPVGASVTYQDKGDPIFEAVAAIVGAVVAWAVVGVGAVAAGTATAAESTVAVAAGNGAFLGEGIASGVAAWDTAGVAAGLALAEPVSVAATVDAGIGTGSWAAPSTILDTVTIPVPKLAPTLAWSVPEVAAAIVAPAAAVAATVDAGIGTVQAPQAAPPSTILDPVTITAPKLAPTLAWSVPEVAAAIVAPAAAVAATVDAGIGTPQATPASKPDAPAIGGVLKGAGAALDLGKLALGAAGLIQSITGKPKPPADARGTLPSGGTKAPGAAASAQPSGLTLVLIAAGIGLSMLAH